MRPRPRRAPSSYKVMKRTIILKRWRFGREITLHCQVVGFYFLMILFWWKIGLFLQCHTSISVIFQNTSHSFNKIDSNFMCSNKNGWNRSPFIGCDAILSAAVHKASILDDDEGSARKDASDICAHMRYWKRQSLPVCSNNITLLVFTFFSII